METITKPGHSENSRQRQKKKLDDEHEIIDRLIENMKLQRGSTGSVERRWKLRRKEDQLLDTTRSQKWKPANWAILLHTWPLKRKSDYLATLPLWGIEGHRLPQGQGTDQHHGYAQPRRAGRTEEKYLRGT